jgi:ribosomal protein L23
MEEKITTSEEKNDLNNQVPPIRNPVILNISKKDQKTQVLKVFRKILNSKNLKINVLNFKSEAPKPSSKKVSMPKDYKEWEK